MAKKSHNQFKNTPNQKSTSSITDNQTNFEGLKHDGKKQHNVKVPKEPFKWTNAKILALLPLLIFIVAFVFLSVDYKVQVVDPWYKAVQLVDSSRNVTDAIIKEQLIEKGGNQLKELAFKFKHPKVQFFLGYYYYQKQQWDSSLYYSRAAFKADSGSYMNPVWQDALKFYIYSAINKSANEINKNDLNGALATLLEIEHLAGDNADVFNNIGMIYSRQNKLIDAAKYFQKAYEINPKLPSVKNNLIITYKQMGNEKALEKILK